MLTNGISALSSDMVIIWIEREALQVRGDKKKEVGSLGIYIT
jgi:hypothetical protein